MTQRHLSKGTPAPPPHNLEAERLVLGGILIDNDQLPGVSEIIKPEAFYFTPHRHIYEAMLTLYDRHGPLDLLTLKSELLGRGLLEKVGGMAYISRLVVEVSAVTNIPYYARMIRERHEMRQVRALGHIIIERTQDGSADSTDVLGYAQQAIYELGSSSVQSEIYTAGELASSTVELTAKLMSGEKKVPGVPTGFKALDNLIQGFHPGELIIVAAKTSVGKSAILLNFARNVAKVGAGILLFTIEMTKEEISNRLVAAEASLSLSKLRSGYINDIGLNAAKSAKDRILNLPIYIDDSATLTPLQARTRAERMKKQYDISIVAVDYLQLMDYPKYSAKRHQEIGMIARELKRISRELGLAVIALSQLSRSKDHVIRRPQLSDLRESGDIENNADGVVFLHNPEKEIDKKLDSNRIEGIVAKQRNGPCGMFDLVFDGPRVTFKDAGPRRWDEVKPPPWVTGDEEGDDDEL